MSQENPTLTWIRQFLSVGRAQLDGRPHSPEGDPEAQHKLMLGLSAVGADSPPVEISEPLLNQLELRAPYFDYIFIDAIRAGITQIVNVGVGFDDRAFRFRHSSVTYFEVDLAHVVEQRRSRVERAGLSFAGIVLLAADVRSDDIAEVLARAGHDASKPTLFVAEGLFDFLPKAAIHLLVNGMARRAAAGSTLAVTAEVHPEEFHSSTVMSIADEILLPGTSPLRAIHSRETWLNMLSSAGWAVREPTNVFAAPYFVIHIDGVEARVQTQFFSATVAPRGHGKTDQGHSEKCP